MIKYIFSDFFGVICGEVCVPWIYAHFTQEEAQEFYEKYNSLLDMGDLSYTNYIKILSDKANVPFEQTVKELSAFEKCDENIRSLYRRVNVPIYLTSNAGHENMAHLLERFNLYDLFTKRFVSCEIKRIKPTKEFFLYVLNDLGIKPEEVLFIDDQQRNVDSAKSLGINTFKYTFEDSKSLENYLNDLGLLK